MDRNKIRVKDWGRLYHLGESPCRRENIKIRFFSLGHSNSKAFFSETKVCFQIFLALNNGTLFQIVKVGHLRRNITFSFDSLSNSCEERKVGVEFEADFEKAEGKMIGYPLWSFPAVRKVNVKTRRVSSSFFFL